VVGGASIDHQEIPWLPVWLATITGSLFVWVEVRSAAKKYSFQVGTSELRRKNEMSSFRI
jgi:hypothetical protein